ncbi:hypothetical protein [Bacillus sp. 2205SS5-2]|uniref:hypothetical protein n=1 Tax=Bacillus sp. 2205SS5-2 TaxID=3109031 RepID=UPI003005BC10
MIDHLNQLITTYESRPHIQKLLPHNNIYFSFKTTNDIWHLKWGPSGIVIEIATQNFVYFTVSGSLSDLTDLLTANQKMSSFVLSGRIQVKGRYRDYLRLESLLWLCRNHETVENHYEKKVLTR